MNTSARSLPGFSSPSASFEVPLEMLSACHGRVEHQCATLHRLLDHLANLGADGPAQEAGEAVTRYFDTAAVHHHADEEQDLFPALLEAVAGSDAVCVRALTAGLEDDHRALTRLWQSVRHGLQQRLLQGSAPGGSALLTAQVRAFTERYAQHIEREETELLPMAHRLLSDAQLDAVGRAMRLRRGIVLPDAGV
jgi:hemerythrin-like domain-containing protein